MSFLALLIVASLLAYLPQHGTSHRGDIRMAMRHGMALALLFTGVDHFINDALRYLPMMPPVFGSWSLPLVWFTGAAEIAGALGLAMPTRAWRWLSLPDLRPATGLALAALFALMVTANVHMAIIGQDVQGLPFGRVYLWVRPWLQPLFIAWALYASGVIGRLARPGGGGREATSKAAGRAASSV